MAPSSLDRSPPRDLLDLRAFCLVCDLGCLTAAARALGESKGSVSRRLGRLERALGVSLLRRSTRALRPTAAGLAYRGQAARALELLDQAAARAARAWQEPSGTLRVTAVQALGPLLGPLVARFVERHPAVKVDLLLGDEVLDFDREQLDVALRAGRRLPDSALRSLKLTELHDVLVAAPAYLRRHTAPRAPAELLEHRLLLPLCAGKPRGPVPMVLADAAGHTVTVRAEGAVRCGDAAFLRAAALDAGGIALVPSYVAAPDLADGALVQVLPDRTLRGGGCLFFVHGPGPFVAARVQAFRDFLVEAFRARGRAPGGARGRAQPADHEPRSHGA